MMVSPLATRTSSIASITASSWLGARDLKTADDTTVERIRRLVASAFKRAPPPPNDRCPLERPVSDKSDGVTGLNLVTGLKTDVAVSSTDGVTCFPPADLAATAVLPVVAPGEPPDPTLGEPGKLSRSASALLPPSSDSTIVGTSRSLRLFVQTEGFHLRGGYGAGCTEPAVVEGGT
eukprot:scaffold7399_cov48-Phaeocystis_antarctica.AAC.2